MPQPRWPDPGRRPPYHDAGGSYRGTRRQARGRQPRPGRAPRRGGSLPGPLGVFLIIGAAALGALATVATRSQPGNLLGVFLVAGTLAAALAVRPRAVYLIIPVPALAYVVAATAAGLARDHAAGTSHTALAASIAQWVAGGFLAMTAATVLAVAATIARRPGRGREPQPPRCPPAAAGTGGPRYGRPVRDPPAPRRPQGEPGRRFPGGGPGTRWYAAPYPPQDYAAPYPPQDMAGR